MTGYQAFRYELAPNNRQRTHLKKHAGCARFAYNWGLARRRALYRATGQSTSANEQSRQLNRLKPTDFPWMYEVSKCAPQQALRDLDQAYRRYFASLKTSPNRLARVGAPRFKRKGLARDSFRLTGCISVSGHFVKLPVLGRLRTKECTSKLKGRIVSATVAREAERWYVAILVEREINQEPYRKGPAVGIDLGVVNFAAVSDDPKPIAGPRALEAGLRKQRRLAHALSRKQAGSRNQRKARLRLARHHRRVANVRRDFIHKLSTRISKTRAVIVVEKLTIAGMLRNKALSRRIADAGWGLFLRQLDYKGRRHGCKVVRAQLFYPSSQKCSSCGAFGNKRAHSGRMFICESCGFSTDRDRNAAQNLAGLVSESPTETLIACGGDVRPAPRRRSPPKQEPSGAPMGLRSLGGRLNRRPLGLAGEPTSRFELETFALPRRRSTT